jgi:hypothetical protein
MENGSIIIDGIGKFFMDDYITEGSFSKIIGYRTENNMYGLVLKYLYSPEEKERIKEILSLKVYFGEIKTVNLNDNILMERMDGSIDSTEFETLLKRVCERDTGLYFKKCREILSIICRTVVGYMGKGYYYVDMKPGNILYKKWKTSVMIFVGDLGSLITKEYIQQKLKEGRTFVSTYFPINVIEYDNGEYTIDKSDLANLEKVLVWNMGVLILYYYLLCPMNSKNKEIFAKVFRSTKSETIYKFLKTSVEKRYPSIYNMLHPNETKRACMRDVIEFLT